MDTSPELGTILLCPSSHKASRFKRLQEGYGSTTVGTVHAPLAS